MKTTIDIPTEEIEQLLKHTGAKTKKDAVLQAVHSYNKRYKMEKLAKMLGTFEQFMSPEELNDLRKDEQ